MPYITKHRPLISPRIKFHPAPYPPRASITHRITFSDNELKHTLGNPDEIPPDHARRSQTPAQDTPRPSLPSQFQPPSTGSPTPVREIPARRVTIRAPSPEFPDEIHLLEPGSNIPLRGSGTMKLRSGLPSGDDVIKKPPGEPGRPNAGGHNVEAELLKLSWTKTQYTALY
ncbi:hypothetical protein H0H92_003720, partial [Tricholoma furcatifolium]